jgi:hypothetical protein
MKIISAGRGQGKTAKLVEISSKEWKHILCKDKQRVDVIIKTAERLGLDIPHPITIRELPSPVKPKEEIFNQMREELLERAKREFFLMEFDENAKEG